MNTKPSRAQGYALTLYLILVPLISLAIALFLSLPTAAIVLLVLLVPPIMAILLTSLFEGRKSLAALLRKVFDWRFSLKWYAVAIGMPIGIIVAAGVLAFLLGWMPSLQIHVPPPSQLIFNFFLIVLVAVLEEFGWRGYALPRLLAFLSPLAAALLIGIAWGALHIGVGLSDGRPWFPTFLNPLALSVTLAWLFVHTRGSLGMAMLFHFVIDYSPQFVLSQLPIAQNVWAQTAVNLALALLLILIYGLNLQRSPAKAPAVLDAG